MTDIMIPFNPFLSGFDRQDTTCVCQAIERITIKVRLMSSIVFQISSASAVNYPNFGKIIAVRALKLVSFGRAGRSLFGVCFSATFATLH